MTLLSIAYSLSAQPNDAKIQNFRTKESDFGTAVTLALQHIQKTQGEIHLIGSITLLNANADRAQITPETEALFTLID